MVGWSSITDDGKETKSCVTQYVLNGDKARTISFLSGGVSETVLEICILN